MQIKSAIIDIHYLFHHVKYLYFVFSLICPAEIGVCLIHPCILYAIKYGIYKQDLTVNNLQKLIANKTQPNQIITYCITVYEFYILNIIICYFQISCKINWIIIN